MNEELSLIERNKKNVLSNLKKKKKLNFKVKIKKTILKVKEKSGNYYLNILIISLIIIIIIMTFLLVNIGKKNRKLNNLKNSRRNITNSNISNINNLENNNNNELYTFISNFKKEYKQNSEQNPQCERLDPINSFNERLKIVPNIICKNDQSIHTCYKNNNPSYAAGNGLICKMKNIVIDPSKWNGDGKIYKGPVDEVKKGKPILSKGFFNMKCSNTNSTLPDNYNKMYDAYFNGWDYNYNSGSDNYEELAPGKTIFFMSRNQDSPNLYHGGSEFINALSLMYLLNLEPENIQIVFLESMAINEDPFYDLYKNLIGRGGEPIYAKNLTKKYIVSNAVHIPMNWDSPCFLLSGVPSCGYPTKTYYFYNKLIDQYLNISDFVDTFNSDGEIFYYPKQILENHKLNPNYTAIITFQWRRVWPKGRIHQQRILGNGPELADKIASMLPKNILLRLIDTASLPIRQQISIMRKTDYFVGIHGAGLTLAIYAPKHCIFHEVLHQHNMNGLALMASTSGHKVYSDIIQATKQDIDDNENIFFNVDSFANMVINHLKENNLI